MDLALTIRDATLDDACALASIYNHYVRTSIATFAESEIARAELTDRLSEAHDASLPWIVATAGPDLLGYAHATKWKGRCAYRFTVEVTVYLAPARTGIGVGSALYRRLLPELAEGGVHAAIGGISLPNAASVALHERFGFEKVAHFREVGYKFDRWIDVGYWELILDPASTSCARHD